jgi:acetyl-CoA/propionyl-CoA carboxylase biotin carboxyl carrier protein
VLLLREPVEEQGVRVDSGLSVGTEVGPWYDPMLSKVIAHGPDRAVALARLRNALARTAVLGVTTNLAFLGELLTDPDVVAGRLDTELVDRRLPEQPKTAAVPDRVLAVYALVRLLELERGAADLWSRPTGWRLGEPSPLRFRVAGLGDDDPALVRIHGTSWAAAVAIREGESVRAAVVPGPGEGEVGVVVNGVRSHWLYAVEAGVVWVGSAGLTWALHEAPVRVRAAEQQRSSADVRSPMPGVVLAVNVLVGDRVSAGQPLIVVEAMKMEYAVAAARPGIVRELLVKVGDQVSLGQLLASTG